MKNKQLEQLVLESKKDKQKLNDLLEAYKPFIASCTQKVSGRFLRFGTDDELSIAMIAFAQAVEGYRPENGDFLSYAGMLIRNKVIDYYRSQKKHTDRISYLKHDDEETEDTFESQASILAYEEEKTRTERIMEIQQLKETLARFDIRFSELESVAPKSRQTRQVCRDVVRQIMSEPVLMNEVLHSMSLPLSQIEKLMNLKRKKFERHRKYILTVLIIKSGDYPYLTEYIKGL